MTPVMKELAGDSMNKTVAGQIAERFRMAPIRIIAGGIRVTQMFAGDRSKSRMRRW